MYADSKYLAKRTVSGKGLKDRACEIALNFKYDGYQKGLASMMYKFYDVSRKRIKVRANANELHKPVIKKIKRSNGLKIVFEQQIQLKWGHYLLRIKALNIYCVS